MQPTTFRISWLSVTINYTRGSLHHQNAMCSYTLKIDRMYHFLHIYIYTYVLMHITILISTAKADYHIYHSHRHVRRRCRLQVITPSIWLDKWRMIYASDKPSSPLKILVTNGQSDVIINVSGRHNKAKCRSTTNEIDEAMGQYEFPSFSLWFGPIGNV